MLYEGNGHHFIHRFFKLVVLKFYVHFLEVRRNVFRYCWYVMYTYDYVHECTVHVVVIVVLSTCPINTLYIQIIVFGMDFF